MEDWQVILPGSRKWCVVAKVGKQGALGEDEAVGGEAAWGALLARRLRTRGKGPGEGHRAQGAGLVTP